MHSPNLTGATDAVELVRGSMPSGLDWHVVTGRDGEGRRMVPCRVRLFYNSAKRLRASRVDLRRFVPNLCPQCAEALTKEAADADQTG